MNFVVGTDLAHMMDKSIVAARRHRALGHVDIKLGLVIVVGTIVGVEGGARAIEMLEGAGVVDLNEVPGLKRHLLGSVTMQVVRRAPSSVLVAQQARGFSGVFLSAVEERTWPRT